MRSSWLNIREKLRLVLARIRELPALFLDFVEKSDVLDHEYGLVGEGGEQLE